MSSLRSSTIERAYRRHLRDGGTTELQNLTPLVVFRHFIIINNDFPHDRIANTHHMLVPRRTVSHWTKLNWRERREFKKLDKYLAQRYDAIKLNYPSYMTISSIVHWHLYRFK